MKLLVRGILGAAVGYVGGFLAGMVWYCNIQDNNLCGIIAIAFTGPIGALIGCAIAALVARGR